MTQDTGGFPPSTTTPASYGAGNETEQSSTVQRAREQVGEVGSSARDAGRHVSQTAADQVKEVASETGRQARDLVSEARTQARNQAVTQQKRVVEGLRALAGELRQMADRNEGTGVATEMARNASERTHRLAGWIDQQEPDDIVEEVRSFARRRPGAFLVGAALAGVVTGRLTRGLAAQHNTGGGHDSGPGHRQEGYPQQGYPQGSGTSLTGDHAGTQYGGTQYAGAQHADPAYRSAEQP
jgi:hypothetical protein